MTPVARRDSLLTQEVGSELIVYDQTRHRVHRLNETAATVWRHCDGNTDVAGIAGHLQASESAEDVVWLALEKLGKANLLEVRVEAPSAVRDQSRRDWMRRAALAGGAVLLLPVVASMSAPTPAMADSNGDTNHDIEILAAGSAVTAAALSHGGGGKENGDDTIPCAQRVPGSGGGCTGAPCGPDLRCLPSLTDPTKCVCR
jgi:hypothetical protein